MTIAEKEYLKHFLETVAEVPHTVPMHMWQYSGPLNDLTLCGVPKSEVLFCWDKGMVDWRVREDCCYFCYRRMEEIQKERERMPF